MILLDTNVLSELIRREPDAKVVGWIDAQDAATVSTTAITVAELLYGVARLPEGRRRRRLGDAIDALVEQDLGGRVEPFDAYAAACYAEVVSDRDRAGRPIGVADAQIAAICRSLKARLASRNIDDFEGTGIDLVDPWRTP